VAQPNDEQAAGAVRTFSGTSGDDVLRGKSTNDFMVGGAGNDRLNGGFGHDVLFGGTGNDTFVFDRNASTKGNSDVIRDFSSGQDTIELSSAKMESLGHGFSSANLFFGEHAHDADHFLIYNQASGELFYDRDGSGSRSAQLIATLDNHAVLRVDDFDIV
jgi:Ca2+-binding RTX toxin-like protein